MHCLKGSLFDQLISQYPCGLETGFVMVCLDFNLSSCEIAFLETRKSTMEKMIGR